MSEQNNEQSTTEVKQEQVLTEVTSIAQEEEKSGQKIELPSFEEMARRASTSFITNKAKLAHVFTNLSGRGKDRVMSAIMDLPTEGIPVFLRKDEEKLAFAIGQRMIADRFVIMQFHIKQEHDRRQKMNEEQLNKEVEQTEKEIENV